MSTSAGRVLIIPQGDYDSETTYNMLDLVRYNNTTYICKETTTGNDPTDTDYWQVMVDDTSVGDLSTLETTDQTDAVSAINELASTKAALTQISNPNLLDNPWFTVNQRGETSLTATDATAFVDRWKIREGTAEVVDGGVKLTYNSGNYAYITQYFLASEMDDLLGKTLTLSAKISDVNMSNAYLCLECGNTSASSNNNTRIAIEDLGTPSDGIYSLTFTMPDAWTNNYFDVFLVITQEDTDSTASGSFVVEAMKLEVGSVSTLAMDTTPNYTMELLKCQRYFISFTQSNLFVDGFLSGSAKSYYMTIPLPTPMRTAPTITMTSWMARLSTGGYSGVGSTEPTNLQVYSNSGTVLTIKDTIATAVDTNNLILSYQITGLTLDADL